MAPRQSSKSLATRAQTALAVAIVPVTMSRETAALLSERNFYKNKTRLLEHDIARLQEKPFFDGDASGRAAVAIAAVPAPMPATFVKGGADGPVAQAEITDALATQAADNAAVLQRQAIFQQLAMARAEARLHFELERAEMLYEQLASLQKLQRSPPYRIAKYLSRRGRALKRLARRLSGRKP